MHLSAFVQLVRDHILAFSVLGYDSTSRFIRPHRMCKRKVPTGKSAECFPMKVSEAMEEFEKFEVSFGK